MPFDRLDSSRVNHIFYGEENPSQGIFQRRDYPFRLSRLCGDERIADRNISIERWIETLDLIEAESPNSWAESSFERIRSRACLIVRQSGALMPSIIIKV